jgi:hypothetical protein
MFWQKLSMVSPKDDMTYLSWLKYQKIGKGIFKITTNKKVST